MVNVKCPFCQSSLSKVVDKRSVVRTGEIRRRRECLKCSRRYTTYEHLAQLKLLVVKRDGSKEPFVREKLEKGLIKALEKRPGVDIVSKIADKIEGRIRTKGLIEVSSQNLGRWVLSELKKSDPIAYLRFASVYRNISDPKDFAKELETL